MPIALTKLYPSQKLTQNGLKTNIRPENVKLLEENEEKKIPDINFGNDFFGYDAK